MPITFLKVLLVALTCGFLGFVEFVQQSSPDLILFNGKVFTNNRSLPYAEALGIRGERIVAVGASKDIVVLAGKETN